MKRAPLIVVASVLVIGVLIALYGLLAPSRDLVDVVTNPETAEPAPTSSHTSALTTDAFAGAAEPSRIARAPELGGNGEAATTASTVGVRGRVRDSQTITMAVANARVRFERAASILTEESDLSGMFAFERVMPGTWRISIEAKGYWRWSEERTIPSDQALYMLDVDLNRTNVVQVRFRTPDGRDLGEAVHDASDIKSNLFITLAATAEAPSSTLAAARDTMWDWPSYVIEPTADPHSHSFDRHIEFTSPLPMYLNACLADAVLDTRYVRSDQDTVTFAIAVDALRDCLHAVHVHVLDAESGEGIPSALVSLFSPGTFSAHGVRTNSNGSAVFDQWAPGRWTLSIDASEYERYQQLIVVAADHDTELGTIRISRGISIEGEFIDESGQPVNNMLLDLVPIAGPDWGNTTLSKLEPETGRESNSFRIAPISRAQHILRRRWEYFVSSGRDLGFRPVLVDTRDGSKKGIVIRCVPTTPVGFQCDETTVDEVRVVDDIGMPVGEEHILSGGRSALRLIPGSYIAKLTKHGTLVRSVPFRVALQNDTQTVDLRQ
jgi:hypothetical protein